MTAQRQQVKATKGQIAEMPGKKGKFSQLGGAISKNPFGAMMMLTAGAGLARGVAGESKGAQAAVGAVETTGQFASMGMMFGPKGAAIGAGIGAIVGVAKAVHKMSDPLPEMKKRLEETKEKLTNFNNASQGYLMALDKFEQGFDDPNITGEQWDKNVGRLEDAFLELPAEVKSRFAGVVGDSQKIKEIFGNCQRL